MKVAVIGLGVGYALSCCLAEAGYETVGVDIDPKIVAQPRSESSVERLFKNKAASKRIERNLRLTTDYDPIHGSTYVIVCVSTGDVKKLVMGHVEGAVRQTLRVLRGSKSKIAPIIMVYSTLPFGSCRRLREVFNEENVKLDTEIGFVHFPLMIAQGTTAEDFVNPPFVVFGSDHSDVATRALTFYKGFIKRSVLRKKLPPTYIGTPEEAELAKLIANAFLTTKIVLSNEIGALCERLNIDGQKIMEIVGSDWRIGRKFTKPGYAAGGQCFPRDLKSLIETFRETQVEPGVLAAVDASNEMRKTDPLEKIEGRSVLVLGRSYKTGVNDERGSPSIDLIEDLQSKGFTVESFDPNFDEASALAIKAQNQEAIIVTTGEKAFRDLGRTLGRQVKIVLDYADIVDRNSLPSHVRLWQAGRGWIGAG